MKKEIDSTTIRRNLQSNTVNERYWKTKITVIGILLILMAFLFKMCKSNSINSSYIETKDVKGVGEFEDSNMKQNAKSLQSKYFTINALGTTVGDVYADFKNKMAVKTQKGITYKFISLKTTHIGGKIEFVCDIQEIDNGFNSFSLVFNPINQPQLSKQSVLKKNVGAMGLSDGVIDGFEYHLIGLN